VSHRYNLALPMVNDRRVTLRRPRRGCGRGDVKQEIQFDPCLAAKMDRSGVGTEGASNGYGQLAFERGHSPST
jgi:hypothetical protein